MRAGHLELSPDLLHHPSVTCSRYITNTDDCKRTARKPVDVLVKEVNRSCVRPIECLSSGLVKSVQRQGLRDSASFCRDQVERVIEGSDDVAFGTVE
jgi:hypothetical protein